MNGLEEKSKIVRVFNVLNDRPKFLIFSADLMPPFAIIATLVFVGGYIIFGMGLTHILGIIVWLCTAWWMLAGEKSYRFTDRLYPLPGKRYYNLNSLFVPATDPGTFKRKMKSKIRGSMVSTRGGREKIVPFQIESDLHCIMQVQFGKDDFSLLLKCDPKGNWSATIPFALDGVHTHLYDADVIKYSESLSELLKDIPVGETLTFKMGCRSKTRRRMESLDELSEINQIPLVELLIESDRQRVQRITEQGFRQEWDQYALVSWHQNQDTKKKNDPLSSLLNTIGKQFSKKSESFAGIESSRKRDVYIDLAKQIYENCYVHWKTNFTTKGSLQCRPLSPQEIWEDLLWYRFNQGNPPPIPQLIRVVRSGQRIESEIRIYNTENPKDIISVLLQGESGRESCPQHGDRRDVVAVNRELVAVMVLEDPVKSWGGGHKDGQRDQLDWLWSKTSDISVTDTEVFLEIANADKEQISTNLTKVTKQSTTANAQAIKWGEGLSVSATYKQQEALQAQARLHQGNTTLYGAMTILVYRDDLEKLSRACRRLANSFSPAKLIREESVCWKLWNETLPFNDKLQLKSTQLFSERRNIYDSVSIRGLLPLRKPQSLHNSGLELISREGGYPIHLNLFQQGKCERAIVTGKSGSGKSVLSFGIILEALARNAKIVGIDMSNAGDSTFKLITQLLGDRGAYFNIAECSLNILQPPDVRKHPPAEREKRRNIWRNSLKTVLVALAMGKIEDPTLNEAVENIITKLLNAFLNHQPTVDRYNNAFDYGWKSSYWQRMPVLEDLIFFCSKEKLGLYNCTDLEERAIAQINNQISAKIVDPNIGKSISRPSNIPPLPQMTFFALSGLTSETNSTIMAMAAQMACLNAALENPRSLFVMDECSVLLDKPGFADVVGERFATGRKEGQSVLLIGQDLDAIANCSSRSKIMQNTDYYLIGKTTSSATKVYEDLLKIPSEVISHNSAMTFTANKQDMFSNWLVCQDDRYWSCQYYPPLISLAALANSQDERAHRNSILCKYPNTERGIIQGLCKYSQQMQISNHASKSKKIPVTSGR